MIATPPSRASHARPIPLTVIGGFLGAGKTTLVNAILAQIHGRRLAVLVNDFGTLSIDAALVSARSAQTISLANGCVCCTLVNGLAQALLDVLRMEPPPDHVLLEASGVGDPRRIAQVARADRAFSQDMTLAIVAADQIQTLARDRYVGDTVLRQLAGADLIVVNKVDLVSGAALDATLAWLREAAPRARTVRTSNAELPCDVVLGPLSTEATTDSRQVRRDVRYADRASDHVDTFATRTLRSAQPIAEAALRRTLDSLPDAVLRAKGFVRFDTAPDAPHVVQLVGRRWSTVPAPPDASIAGSVLVLVGAARAFEHADLADIARLFDADALSR